MSTLFAVIVPVTRMSGRLEVMHSWLRDVDSKVIEVILVHDNQDTSTGKELSEIVKNLPSQKITLIEGKFDSPGAARNAGLVQAKSSWIVFWDSDDLPNVEEFILMIRNADSTDYKIAIGGYETISYQSEEKINGILSLPTIGKWGSNIPLNPGIWRWAFKREIVGDLRFENFLMGEDQCFLVSVEPLSKELYVHEKSVYSYYLNRPGQLTGNSLAINEITKSIRFLKKLFRSRKARPNYFELIILLRQSLTAIKKGNLQTKIYGARSLAALLTSSIFLNIQALIESIKCIYLLSLRRKSNPPNSEVLSIGGLGNQLFQLAAGLHFSGANELSFDYSAHQKGIEGSKDLSEFLIPSHVQLTNSFKFDLIQKKIINFCIRMSSSVSEKIIMKDFRLRIIPILQAVLGWIYPGNWKVNLGVGFDENHDLSPSNYHIGYFQTRRYFDDAQVQQSMRDLRLRNPSEPFIKNCAELVNMDSLVVHIRLGDYVNESNFGIPSKKYFHDSIIELWNLNIFSRISLFSNDIFAALEYIPSSLQEHLWMPSKRLTSAAETLELMRHGKGYVLSNSSFSWWAAALSYTDTPSVICPTPWFQKKTEPVDLVPKEWTRKSSLDL